MKKLTLLMALILFCSWQFALAQKTITGTVTDAKDGTTIPGVNVVVKGSTTGTVTDLTGKYSIKANTGQTLQFSFVGYIPQEVLVGQETTIDLKFEPSVEQLEGVVVTAMGISREKKSLGYSITEVKGKDLATISPVSPVNALQGRVAGLNIAPNEGGVFAGSKIQLRGNSTLGANNMPIFVIDGVIIDNELSGGSEWGGVNWGNNLKNLNSDEFESVSVLKGSAATALYGSRALHGAIVITTKKGKTQKGLGVSFSQRVNFTKAYDGPAFQNVYGEGAIPGFDSRYADMYAPQNSFLINAAGEPYIEGTAGEWWVPMSLGHKMDGSKIRDYEGNWITYDPQPDNYLKSFQNGFQSNTNITIDGSGDNSTFLISYSNMKDKGIYPRNTFDRNSVFSKITRKFNDVLSAELGLSYSNATPKNPPAYLEQNFITGNWPRNYNTDYAKTHYRAIHGGVPQEQYGDAGWATPGADVWFGVYEDAQKRTEEALRLTPKITVKIADWVNVVFEGYLNNYYTTEESTSLGRGYANEGGSYSLGHNTKEQYDGKIWLNFNKAITSDIDFRASLVGEHWQTKYSYSSAYTNGGLIVPGQYSLSNSKQEAGQSAGISGQKILQSVYAFTDLSWKGQVYLSVTGRNDWSSTLVYADGTGNFSYFYPSVSLSWVMSESLKFPTWVSYGKLRASWAHVGNDFNPYDINPGFSRTGTVQSYNGDLPTYSFKNNTMPNKDIKPEDKKAIELGLEYKFFNNRYGFDFTYYKENTYNQILSIPAPFESGVGSILINAGNIQNQGIEMELHTIPLKINDFEWFLDATFARNRNKVIDLYEGIEEYALDGSWNYGNTRIGSMAIVGGDYGVLMSDSKPKLYQNTADPNDPRNGLPLLTWSNGQRGAYEERNFKKEAVGNMNPDFTGSIITGFTFKNFRVSAMFDFKIGGDISTYSGRYGSAYGLFESTLEGRDAASGGVTWTSPWTGNQYDDGYIPEGVFKPGTVVNMKDPQGNSVSYDVSGMTYQDAYAQGKIEPTHKNYWTYRVNSWSRGVINDNVLQENSYIGFRELTVTYQIPSSILEKVRVSRADISFVGRDLGYLYKTLKDNLNPFSVRSNRSGDAHEWQQTPYTRSLGVSLNVSF